VAAKALVVGGYFFLLLLVGFFTQRRARAKEADYFLASRSLSPLLLFITMAATNFSAFTVFGFSGAGWRIGYAFYPIMAFGTGFMALSFFVIGRPVWRLGREKGLLTPPELILDRLGSPTLRLVFLAVLVAFTLPYLAMQPMAAGYALEGLLGIPYVWGAVLVTAVMLAYMLLGGMRAVAWTAVVQGVMMIVFLALALGVIAAAHGGLTSANRSAAEAFPALFSRPGGGSVFGPGVWLGYLLLWLLCDPMFPQLFQRFYAARSLRALSLTATLYPLVTGGLFLCTVSIGVIGRLSYPTLESGAASDSILPMLLSKHAPGVIEALVLTAGLAALMSTLDSQLLTLSSMVSRDLLGPLLKRRRVGEKGTFWIGKALVLVLGIGGLLLALRLPGTLLDIATESFTGFAVLFPTVIAALYWPRVTPAGAVASILVGEGLLAAYRFNLLPSFGTLPVVPIVLATTVVLVAGSLLSRRPKPRPGGRVRLTRGGIFAALGCLGLFALANDVWSWGDARLGPLGFPLWVWYAMALCVATAVLFGVIGHVLDRPEREAAERQELAEKGNAPGRRPAA